MKDVSGLRTLIKVIETQLISVEEKINNFDELESEMIDDISSVNDLTMKAVEG